MTDPTEPARDAVEHPAEGGRPAPDFAVVNDEQTGAYWAMVGDRQIAGLPYQVAGDHRLVLLGTSVFPEFRRRGIATGLIRHVLDDVRAQGKTVTVMCPVVRTFIEHNSEYAPLIDPDYPGVTEGHR